LNARTALSAAGEAAAPAKRLAAMLRSATGLPLPVVENGGAIRLSLDPALAPALGKEGYRLDAKPSGVEITAANAPGLFYGAQTLLQLLPTEKPTGGWALPAVSIRDKPQFPWRGMMLDVSRYFLTKEYVMRYLDMMARHKMNVLHWHLIDDPGWRIEIKKYPKLTEIGAFRGKGANRYGGFYTQEDIREIVRHAAERHITIVPEIELPAHTISALAAYPWLGCTGKQFQVPTRHSISPELYCAGKESTWTFLEDVMDEVCGLFPGTFIHIGGDEAKYPRWKACPDCQAKMKELGLKSEHELQGWMTTRIEAYLAKKGRRIIGWDEILKCGVSPKAGVMTWYRPNTAVDGARRGNPVVMSLTRHAYFDTPESKLPGEPPAASWIPPVSLQNAYDWDPVPKALENDPAKKNILGASGCIWTDMFMHNARILADKPGEGTTASEAYVDYLSLPRMAALAEVTWTPKSLRDFDDFQDRMAKMYPRYIKAGYKFRTPTPRLDIRKNPDGTATVAAKSPIAGAVVRYTTDGSDPTTASPELTGTIALPKNAELKTATFAAGGKLRSLVATYSTKPPQKKSRNLAKFGKRIGEWKPGQAGIGKPKEMVFDATGPIDRNGTYTLTFIYTGGRHRLDIDGIEVVKNGTQVVAKDIHHGVTGARSNKNSYTFKIDNYETGASFKIKARVYGDTGNDTRGTVLIRREK
jgi:hexosaminidase